MSASPGSLPAGCASSGRVLYDKMLRAYPLWLLLTPVHAHFWIRSQGLNGSTPYQLCVTEKCASCPRRIPGHTSELGRELPARLRRCGCTEFLEYSRFLSLPREEFCDFWTEHLDRRALCGVNHRPRDGWGYVYDDDLRGGREAHCVTDIGRNLDAIKIYV